MDGEPDLDALLDQLDAGQPDGFRTSHQPVDVRRPPASQSKAVNRIASDQQLDLDAQLAMVDANHNEQHAGADVEIEPLLLDLSFEPEGAHANGGAGDLAASPAPVCTGVSIDLLDIDLNAAETSSGAQPDGPQVPVQAHENDYSQPTCSDFALAAATDLPDTEVFAQPATQITDSITEEVRELLAELVALVTRTVSPSQPLHLSLTDVYDERLSPDAAADATRLLDACVDDGRTVDERIDEALAELESLDAAVLQQVEVAEEVASSAVDLDTVDLTQPHSPPPDDGLPSTLVDGSQQPTASDPTADVHANAIAGEQTVVDETDVLDDTQQQAPVEVSTPAVEEERPARLQHGRLVTDERSLDQFWDNSWHLTESEMQLGKVKPYWIPDVDSPHCMLCSKKFTVVRRRHHCRSCGRVLCAACCKEKIHLPYLGCPERVCEPCSRTLERVADAEAERQRAEQQAQAPSIAVAESVVQSTVGDTQPLDPSAEPNSSDSPPPSYEAATGSSRPRQEESAAEGIGASASVSQADGTPVPFAAEQPAASSGSAPSEQRRVMFSDGHRPGSAPDDEVHTDRRRPPRKRRSGGSHASSSMQWLMLARELNTYLPSALYDDPSHPLHANLPVRMNESTYPVAVVDGARRVMTPDALADYWNNNEKPLRVLVKRNLHVLISRLHLDCCTGDRAWLLKTDGMRCAGADELVLVVQRPSAEGTSAEQDQEDKLQDELNQAADPYYLPPSLFPNIEYLRIFDRMYELSIKGVRYGEYDTLTVEQLQCWAVSGSTGRADAGSVQLLGGGGVHALTTFDQVYAACLFHRPSLQCLHKVCDADQPAPAPTLFMLLVRREELSWARALPLRLLMRAGMCAAVYPWPIVNPIRRPVYYSSTEQSMLALFVDFNSGSYSVPHLRGATAVVDVKGHITLSIPLDQHSKVVSAMDGHCDNALVAFGAQCDVSAADSHLVAEQTGDPARPFRTHVFAIEGRRRERTSATFFVLNAGTGMQTDAAHLSLVEDGVVVRLGARAHESILSAIREKRDFSLPSGQVHLCWLDAEATSAAAGLYYGADRSAVDGRSLRGCRRVRLSGELLSATAVAGADAQLRLVELLLLYGSWTGRTEPAEGVLLAVWSQVGKVLEQCVAPTLAPFADLLRLAGVRTVVLRVCTGNDALEYNVAEWRCADSADGQQAETLADAHAMWRATLDDVMIPALVQHATGLPSAKFELTYALLDTQ